MADTGDCAAVVLKTAHVTQLLASYPGFPRPDIISQL